MRKREWTNGSQQDQPDLLATSPHKNLSFGQWMHHVLCFAFDKVSLCNPGCPGTHCVNQAGLELTEISLRLPPLCWEKRREPLHKAYLVLFKSKSKQIILKNCLRNTQTECERSIYLLKVPGRSISSRELSSP